VRSRGRSRRSAAGAASFRFAAGTGGEPADAPAPLRPPWALKTTDTLRPGERGTRRLVAEHGDRLVCVRYRCDPERRKRYKTVELIVAEADWIPPPGPDDLVQIRVAFGEEALRQRVKQAGGRWLPDSKSWELPLRVVEELGLEHRLVTP
jgi:hypothetical protein